MSWTIVITHTLSITHSHPSQIASFLPLNRIISQLSIMASAIFQANRTALITGGASGVGFAFAQLCQKYGMNVALVDKSTEALGKAKEILTGSAKNTQKTEVYEMVCSTDDL